MTAAQNSSWAEMYDRAKLLQELPRFKGKIQELYDKGVLPFLTAQERRALAGVQFQNLLIGKTSQMQDLGPLDYYSRYELGQPHVVMPVLSLLFLEDLCTAYAWLHANGYSLETIDEYVTMLKYKKASAFPGGRYPAPLQALQIPGNALADTSVDQLSLGFRNSAFAFILLHELGHILFRHPGYEGVPRQQTRRNEMDADDFALDVLSRPAIPTIPMGAILFFQAQAYFMPSEGQLKAEGRVRSTQEWQDYLDTHLTHPLTADRLLNMARHLDEGAGKYGADRANVKYIASGLANIVTILQDEKELQGAVAMVASRADPSILAPRRPGAVTGTVFERWCRRTR